MPHRLLFILFQTVITRATVAKREAIASRKEAVSALAEQPFDAAEFPFAFLEAFGNKETTLKRLRKGESNKSDLGGVLQTNNIHIAVCRSGEVYADARGAEGQPGDGQGQGEIHPGDGRRDVRGRGPGSGETVACAYADFPDHFGFFLPLAGITTVKQISENAFDIRATSR